ncbi:hypothetical protein BJX68DRAFT_267603 [Aspergillus pseudodeflectus]|uniref:Uncharacterized protein n=1 Tax=Aspergillus pseudodeflectus TaxID=176178 RepID=A0ABR4K8W5_9EURO
MASLILIGAVLVAAKAADEHEKKKRDGPSAVDNIIPFTPQEQDTPLTEPMFTSKRDILSRRYWHERRRSKKHVQIASCSPPPYEVQPMYREPESEKDAIYELDGSPIPTEHSVHELAGPKARTRFSLGEYQVR